MAAPKSVSAADLVPHSKLKVAALSPHESDGTGLQGQVGLRLDEIPAAPTADGVAIGVAPRHATDLSPCQRIIWGSPAYHLRASAFTTIIVDLTTVWLCFMCFFSAANFFIELERHRWDSGAAGTAGLLLLVAVGLNLFICCLRQNEACLPTSCLETASTAEETKAPVVTVAVRH